MEPITEFPLFRYLPPEIRIKIWKLVPQPTRVIGLLPQVCTWYRQYFQEMAPRSDGQEVSPDNNLYDYRYVVQPKRCNISPPLHVNREARAVWLPRFFRPPRRVQISDLTIEFGTPFISYETDIFTVFDGWPLDGLQNGIATGSSVVDGFIGLERSRIRNIAVCEYPRLIERVSNAISINTLPNLEVFTILSMGPCIFSPFKPKLSRDGLGLIALGGYEMLVADVQRTSCEIHDLSKDVVHTHSFFNHARLFHPGSSLYPLYGHQIHLRSWLWHDMQEKHLNQAAGQIVGSWWSWMGYMLDNEEEGEEKTCPLTLDGCGDEGHTKKEMRE
ncbi:hypothetical protein TRIATDRAFT_261152 [Trichoderma atroviride IMI 206040]|uniref:2EXR domain-containing protein n=1 Tax=Hypocrea atroviridis (strain ATCC 20476 / IMI 206040) TaxID=452589 RepID=G9NGM7_HYPAI|nr:uncharacterized protein TRIATDRAFT_261152 [Trichoderma atroviride IMI 206040]EHK50438.1 hypothetical protein TRIATDRAFT_261152 [Trichoderma atroviride IMI 206040]